MKKRKISYRIGSIAVIALFELGGICLIALANIPFKKPYIWWEAWGRDTARFSFIKSRLKMSDDIHD